jgi:phosphopantothenoylcysteine decarboxylase
MNTLMWEHPLTVRHLRQLGGEVAPGGLDVYGVVTWINRHAPKLRVVPPQSKRLACGDTGVGAMAEVGEIVAAVESQVRVVLG